MGFYEKNATLILLTDTGSARRCEPSYTLKEQLESRSVKQLRYLARYYDVSYYTSFKKEELISVLYEKILDQDKLRRQLIIMNTGEWRFFRKVSAEKHIVDDPGDGMDFSSYSMIFIAGIMGAYVFYGHVYFVVPDEVKQIYNKLVEDGFAEKKERSNLLGDYANAAVNLYGVISISDFSDLFNSQIEQKTSSEEVLGCLSYYVTSHTCYYIESGYIISDEFENDFDDDDFNYDFEDDSDKEQDEDADEGELEHVTEHDLDNDSENVFDDEDEDYDDELDDDIQSLITTAGAKPRYIPEKEKFLRYSDKDYVEASPQLDKLRLYIFRELIDDEAAANEIAEEFYFLAREESEIIEYIEVLDRYDILADKKKVKPLLNLIFDLSNNVRTWNNNGHTAAELAANSGETLRPLFNEPVRVVKIGRNEPCPCGSGKKYKKCCGA